jgi:hypothetical protein
MSEVKNLTSKIMINSDEILFGEVKQPKYGNSSLLINRDFLKLVNFQTRTLVELIKKNGNGNGITTFGIWISGRCLN